MYNDVLNIYLLLLSVVLILNALGIYSYITSTNYNRNLKLFDNYHEDIESSFKNKIAPELHYTLEIPQINYILNSSIGDGITYGNALSILEHLKDTKVISNKEFEIIKITFNDEKTRFSS